MSRFWSWSYSRLNQSEKINMDIWGHQYGNKQEQYQTAAQLRLTRELLAKLCSGSCKEEKRDDWRRKRQMLQKQPNNFDGTSFLL